MTQHAPQHISTRKRKEFLQKNFESTWLWIKMKLRSVPPVMMMPTSSSRSSPQRIRFRRSRIFAKLCRVTIQNIVVCICMYVLNYDTLQRPMVEARNCLTRHSLFMVFDNVTLQKVFSWNPSRLTWVKQPLIFCPSDDTSFSSIELFIISFFYKSFGPTPIMMSF